jgi:hypothetical protein
MYTFRESRARRGGSVCIENDHEDSMNRMQSESGIVLGGATLGASSAVCVR